jgi:proteic killer suppression protein
MIVEFEKKYLRELYEEGKTSDKRYRFHPEVIKGYARTIYRLQAAKRFEDLFLYKSLHYEKLQGKNGDIHSIRANLQYRIEFTTSVIMGEDVITVCHITELSNHYQ